GSVDWVWYCLNSCAVRLLARSVETSLVEDELSLLLSLSDDGGGPGGGPPAAPRMPPESPGGRRSGISPVSDAALTFEARSFNGLACCESPLSAASLAAASSLSAIFAVVSLNWLGSDCCRFSSSFINFAKSETWLLSCCTLSVCEI